MATLVVQCNAMLDGLRAGVDHKVHAPILRIAPDLTKSHDVVAKAFVAKFFRGRQDDVHMVDSIVGCSNVRGCVAGSRDVTGGCVSGDGAAHGWAATSPLSPEVRQQCIRVLIGPPSRYKHYIFFNQVP